ncbi:Homoserine dehydrogenase [invertebrate metagenome]|uniref:Homoserine dehydrogenase n=1 Tax=invertebrate metagenome TaxID=1711999 RepID=A0A2H9TB26_9ZZZZ
MNPLRVGICGAGTVGSGVINVLRRNITLISARAGCPVIIEQIGARRDNSSCPTSDLNVTRNILDVANNPNIDILVELIGGCDDAQNLILTAIDQGKHIVTANKALIAEKGHTLLEAAHKKNVIIAFEAAVAGSIPVIKCLRESLAANQVHWLAGIINGTGNFILTKMGDEYRSFSDVLTEAQTLGYAEADPIFDVEGIDACHKLTIMASIAFGIPLQFTKAYTEGISTVTPDDIRYASEMGYRIKHLGIARQHFTSDNTPEAIELRVHPALIPKTQPIANINGVLNTVMIDCDAAGPIICTGTGAGSEATASAVIADIIDIARIRSNPTAVVYPLGKPLQQLNNKLPILPVEEITTRYYLRIHAADHHGVMNAITNILSKHKISIAALTQKANRDQKGFADIVILTHQILEKNIDAAITEISQLTDINQPVTRIRVEAMS